MRGPAGRLLLCCALLLALLWQSLAGQAHHHLFAAASPIELAVSAKAGGGDPASDSPATCPICLEVANAGPAMLPTAIVLAQPVPTAVFTAPPRPSAFALPRQSHVWRSRAPPQPLRA